MTVIDHQDLRLDSALNLDFPVDAETVIAEQQQRDLLSSTGLGLLTAEEFVHRPQVGMIVDTLLPAESLVEVFGLTGRHKSRLTLGLCLAVASGHDFLGFQVEQPGMVVYAGSEGRPGQATRLEAWRQHFGPGKWGDLVLDPRGVPKVFSSAAERYIDGMARLKGRVKLIALDNFRAMLGGHKEDDEGAGQVATFMEELKQATGATILTIHNCGWPKNTRTKAEEDEGLDSQTDPYQHERNSSLLRDAMDEVLYLRRVNGVLRLYNEKGRDHAKIEPLKLQVSPVSWHDPELGPVESVVLENLARPSKRRAPQGKGPALDKEAKQMLEVLADRAEFRQKDWKDACDAAGVGRSTFDRRLRDVLAPGGYAEHESRGKPWRLTAKGREALGF